MDNEEIKQKLLQIENTELEFTVTMTGKESTRVNGLYKPDTHEILLHNKNFKSDMQLIYTAIHEYTHHLLTEEFIAETGGKLPMKGTRVHNQAFWARFHALLQKAEELGIYKIDLEDSPELKELTEKIRREYMEVNGKLMQEFGKLLAEAHALCEKANIRYEDYLDRVLCLPRNTAKDITKLGRVEVNPALGFDNMKKVAMLKKSEDRDSATQAILGGKSPDTVTELMKKASGNNDPRAKLEKEKNRLTKTIEALQQRLQYVEESLEQL
ncbi:MAG: hypothetical protein J6I53_03145 [Treponema sp.]|uniref:hypothetical protein n=1 Tax=Treponema sp. TaxID=166 RepID=UPI001B689A50|nr:hypothetical protein [Treponema sp.]MBP3771674.1 hypothetical protein [Treponema sp.]MBQ9282493.1 hypothetical protein [Treponema sp.]